VQSLQSLERTVEHAQFQRFEQSLQDRIRQQLPEVLTGRFDVPAKDKTRTLEHQHSDIEVRRTRKNGKTSAKPDIWHYFLDEFQALAREEREARAAQKDRLLRAYCSYEKHPEVVHEYGKPEHGPFCLLQVPECGLWMLSDGLNENFRARFDGLASRAGLELGCSKGVQPLDYWLHKLWLDLRMRRSSYLFAASDEGGVIRYVCEASATFAARLEQESLQLGTSAAVNVKGMKRQAGSRERKTFVMRILDRKGWSILDWANEANLDFHTVNDYLKGKTKPYRSTRKKMAEALGVTVDDLPK
jgi:hypothetical protein